MKLWSTILVLVLAASALLFATSCEILDLARDLYGPQYTLACSPASNTLHVEDDNLNDLSSPLNGVDCSVSLELQGRPYSTSEAVGHGLIPRSGPSAARVASSATSLINDFASLVPLMFPPRFPASDRGKTTTTCDSTVGSYVVNHTNGTVTSVGLCPLRILKVIRVRSHPLQLQVTPDGSMVLVTSFDGAVTFIDTSSDTVAFTLDTPGFTPSGIAVSPDGTRAYVTHYDDVNPALIVIDIPNRKILTSIRLPLQNPRVVTLTPDGTQAWVNYLRGNVVTIVDTLTNTVSNTLNIQVPVSTGMAFNPTGTRAFIAVYPSSLYVIDTATLSVLARVPVGGEPMDVVVTADGNDVLVNSSIQDGIWDVDARRYSVRSAPTTAVTGRGSMGLTVYR